MKYSNYQMSILEVPGEVSLVFSISGCPLRCDGCHTPELRNAKYGVDLTMEAFVKELDLNAGYATCVLFMGGEWHSELDEYLIMSKHKNYKTALYTGATEITPSIAQHLDYLKVGAYDATLGGLESPTTNQRLYQLPDGKDITAMFWRSNVIHAIKPIPN